MSQGGLQYLVTDEVVPSSSSPHPPPTNGHITPPPPVQASTNPQTAAIQHGGATAPGNFLTFTEEDFAEVGEDEFAEAWAAIGKVVRARIARERERIDQETIRSPIASHMLTPNSKDCERGHRGLARWPRLRSHATSHTPKAAVLVLAGCPVVALGSLRGPNSWSV